MTTTGSDSVRPWDHPFTYPRDRRALRDAIHIFVLTAFAVAQPVYDLLGRNAEFFVAHRSSRGDILTLVLLLSAALPAAIALVRLGVGLVSSRAGHALHALIVFAGFTLIVLPIFNKLAAFPGAFALLASGVSGLAAAAAYFRFAPIRSMASVVSPAAVLFPALFLFATPVSRLIVPPENPRLGAVSGTLDTPIVVVVFDELPLVQLMDEAGGIDAHRFPNFAALAATSHWFRNATTVSEYTVYGIPSILTGRFPPPENLVPTVGDYPENLFTLLAGTHAFNVAESITTLCPETVCDADTTDQDGRRRLLLADTTIVFLNIVAPRSMAAELPGVSGGWADFAPDPRLFGEGVWQEQAAAVMQDDRAAAFRAFVDRLTADAARSLSFIHVLLPHEPLSYTPSGHTYDPAPARGRAGEADDLWAPDAAAMHTTLQRHLLQVQFADGMVGTVVRRLKEVGTYEESLLVVLADHGASFRPGGFKRTINDDNFAEIMAVPLFIKLPHQQEGFVSDSNVQTIDVLPTIADVIGVQMPWAADGSSVFETDGPKAPHKTLVMTETKERRSFEGRIWEKAGGGRGRAGRPGDSLAIYRVGPFADLIGADGGGMVAEPRTSAGTATVDQARQLARVALAGEYRPVYLTGAITPAADTESAPEVAILVNGRIAAVTRARPRNGGGYSFEAIMPEELLVEGRNIIEVCAIRENAGSGPTLLAFDGHPGGILPATLDWTTAAEAAIRPQAGNPIPVVASGIVGGGDVRVSGTTVTFLGWAFDSVERTPVNRVVLFVDGEQVASSSQQMPRPDVVKALGDEAALRTGYSFSVPAGYLRRSGRPIVEVYAVARRGVATPLGFDDRSRERLMTALDVSVQYRLVEGDSGLVLHGDDGAVEPVEAVPILGRINGSALDGDRLVVQGFALDATQNASPLELYVFAGGDLLHAGGFWIRRADVAAAFEGGATMSHSGFMFDLPLSRLTGIEGKAVRFIGRFRDGSLRLLQFDSAYNLEPRP